MTYTIDQLITLIEQETDHEDRLNFINELEHLCYIEGTSDELLRLVRVLYDVNEELVELMNREGLEP